MRKILFLLLFTPVAAHAQNWQWAKETGRCYAVANNIGLTHMVGDGQGNTLVTGGYIDTIPNGLCSIEGEWIPYLYRFDTDGNCIGLRQLPGIGAGICIDGNGHHTVVGHSNVAGYVSKYTDLDAQAWTKTFSNGTATAIRSDNGNNIILAGLFSSADVASGCEIEGDPFMNKIFLVKFDEQGNCLWALQSENAPDINAIDTDAEGNIVVTGSFTGQLEIGSISLVSNGAIDMVVAKFSSNGECLWAKQGGGTSVNLANYSKDNGLAVDLNDVGDIYVTGSFTDGASFGQVELLGRAGGNNVFVARYSPQGDVLWAKGYGDRWDNEGYALGVTPNGNLVVGGRFVDYIQFDSIQLNSVGQYDLFAVEMDPDGNILWAVDAGGSSWNESISSLTIQNNDLVITGVFYGESTFGPFTLSGEGPRSYIAKIGGVTGIGEALGTVATIIIYPNPSSGTFTLSWEATATEQYSLMLYDAQGRAVQTHSGHATAGRNAVQLELSHLPSGIYFGRLAAGDGVRSFKWVRE